MTNWYKHGILVVEGKAMIQRGKQVARIPIDPELRNQIQQEKRGEENWTDVLRRIYTEWLECKGRLRE